MDESSDGQVEELIQAVMYFYKGAVQYDRLQYMPIPQLVNLREGAERIARIQKQEVDKYGR